MMWSSLCQDIVSASIISSFSHDLGSRPVSGRLSRGHGDPHLLRGGSPCQPQLLGEGRGDDPRQWPLRLHPGAGVTSLQSKTLGSKNTQHYHRVCIQVEMKLTIRRAGEPHFGKYTCVAKNPRGQTDGSITLYGGCLKILSISRYILWRHCTIKTHSTHIRAKVSLTITNSPIGIFFKFGLCFVFVARAPPTTTTPLTTPTTTSTTLLTYKVHLQEKQQGNIQIFFASCTSSSSTHIRSLNRHYISTFYCSSISFMMSLWFTLVVSLRLIRLSLESRALNVWTPGAGWGRGTIVLVIPLQFYYIHSECRDRELFDKTLRGVFFSVF